MGRTDMLKLVNNPLQQCKQCVLKELVMPKNGQCDTNAAYRFIKRGEDLCDCSFFKRNHHSHLGKDIVKEHLFVWNNNNGLEICETRKKKIEPGRFCFVCATNIEASIPFLHEVVSSASLDANLGRLSQLEVEAVRRCIAVASNPTFNHLPVLPILTCKHA